MCKRARSFFSKNIQKGKFSLSFANSVFRFPNFLVILHALIYADMKLLLILLSVMTFTVKDKRTVTADGSWPYDMSATYYNTGNKGSVTSNDTATLRVSGLDGITIEQIKVYVRSNKSAGAGKITMSADGTQIYQKEGTYQEWFGAYDNTNYQPIGWSGRKTVNALEVQVTGSTNSLHIEKYEIGWTQAPSYTVTLMNGNEVYDVLNGSTVTLPAGLEPVDAWEFSGWSESEFWETEQMPVVRTGSYHPTSDVTLWAVYQKDVTPTLPCVTDLTDGAYIYLNTKTGMAMSGVVESGVAGAEPFDPYSTDQAYEIKFDTSGRATIQLMYIYGEAYIGYEGTQLANTPSKWDVYHEGEKTAFYTTAGDKTYMLLPGMMRPVGEEYVLATELVEVDQIEKAPTVLRTTDMPAPLYLYTCHPEAEGFETVRSERMNESWNEGVIRFGNYELHVRKGVKELRVSE